MKGLGMRKPVIKDRQKKRPFSDGRGLSILSLNLIEIEQFGRSTYSSYLLTERDGTPSLVSHDAAYVNRRFEIRPEWTPTLSNLRNNIPALSF